MELNFNEADFLMHCVELFVGCDVNSSFMDCESKQVMMDSTQINDLFLKIQEAKFKDYDPLPELIWPELYC